MVCPVCGREEEGLCIDCLLKEKPMTLREIELPVCDCGRYFYRGRWSPNIEDFIDKFVRNNLMFPDGIRIDSIDIDKKFLRNKIRIMVRIYGNYNNGEFETEIRGEIGIKRVVCTKCSRLGSRYYEAVLQFRVAENPINEIDNEFVSNIRRVSNGFDIYITSTQYARHVGRRFEMNGFVVKESSKLVGRKDGKDVYRVTISIKEPDIRIGDIVEYKGNILKVIGTGKRIMVKNIKTSKKSSINRKYGNNLKIISRKEDVRKGIITATKPDEIQVLDIEDNRVYDIPKTEDVELGGGVDIVIIRNRVYIV